MDSAYQGFGSGSIDKDGFAVRLFAKDGHELIVSQSFSKNMGLYGERVGAVSLITHEADARDRVLSQLKVLIRRLYSNPPRHGAQIASKVFK